MPQAPIVPSFRGNYPYGLAPYVTEQESQQEGSATSPNPPLVGTGPLPVVPGIGTGAGDWWVMTADGLVLCEPQMMSSTGLVPLAGGTANGPAGGGGGPIGSGNGVNTLAEALNDMQQPHDHRWPGAPGSSWEYGPVDSNASPPLVGAVQCSACLPWFQISYTTDPPSADTNTRVQVRMLELYCYSTSRHGWVVASQVNTLDVFGGYEYPNDFGLGTAPSVDVRDERYANGGISFLLSKQQTTGSVGQGQVNCCIRGFPDSRADLTALGLPHLSDITSIFTTAQFRLVLDDPNGTDDRALAAYMANAGCDFWLNTNVGAILSRTNSPTAGQGRLRTIPTNGSWVACNFWTGPKGFQPTWTGGTAYSVGLTLAQMQADPPPLNALGA